MKTHMRVVAPAVVLSTLLSTVTAAHAMGGLFLIDSPPKQDWTFSAGPSVLGFPEAPGSSKTKVLAIPGIDFYAPNGIFASTDDGLGWNLSKRDDLQAGVRLWPVFGRDNDGSRRRGLQDIGTRLGKGVFLNWAPWEFLTLQSSVLYGSGRGSDGLQVEAGATVGTRVGPNALLGLTLGTTWANGAHVRSYYGVTPAETAAGGLPTYRPGSGLIDVNLALTGEYKFDERWRLSGQVLGARLMGDAKRSPVTLTKYPETFSLTLWYKFH